MVREKVKNIKMKNIDQNIFEVSQRTVLKRVLENIFYISLSLLVIGYFNNLEFRSLLFIILIIISVFSLFSFIINYICYKHDSKIKIEVIGENINYFEFNELLLQFKIDDIQSITNFSFLKNDSKFYSINLKNKVEIYLSDLFPMQDYLTKYSEIEREEYPSYFLNELWNPIYSIKNQIRTFLH